MARLPAPNQHSDSWQRPWPYSAPVTPAVEAARAQRQELELPVGEVMPQVHIAHRLLGEVGVGYRIIYDHELIAVIRGLGDLYLDGHRYPVVAPCLLSLPPWVPHTVVTRTGASGDHIAIHFDLAPGCPDRPQAKQKRSPYAVTVLGAPHLPPVQNMDDVTLSALGECLRWWRASDALAPLRASRSLQGVLLRLWSRAAVSASGVAGDPGVVAALAMIAERFAEPLTVADLARCAGLGRSRFAERFTAWTGRTPAAFLRRYRVDRCCALLLEGVGTLGTLGTIAPQLGYSDAFALSKAVRAELGCSPKAWLEEQRSGVLDML
ncbi:MAG: AraC family transcriptional regulator [Planctomycetota bacterium]|jgi:AraC-like DNA-binding protein|nr:AraC family transcriptional regulator [Planctomycetota bacterium]